MCARPPFTLLINPNTAVENSHNGILIGTDTTSPFSFAWNGVTAGTYILTAIATDGQGATTTSAARTVVVDALPTISLTATPATGVAPANIVLTATPADTDGTITKVDFFQGATLIATVNAPGPYTFTVNNLAAGNYTFTARATDSSNLTATSAPASVTLTVNQAPTVSITVPANNATFVAPASISITATASDTDGTIAKVELYNNATLIATLTASPYTFSLTNVPVGTYALTAIATDNLDATTASAAVNVTVNANQAPTVNLTSPADNAVFTAPATITLTANANDTDGTIAQVEFLSGSNVIATLTAAPYTFDWTNVGVGGYTLTARATDDKGAQTTSAPVTVTVNAASATIFYIYTDQLNTPRAITNEAATTIWKWDNVDPFGANAPNEDPDGDTNKFVFNLRFPGQYFDKETNTHYNYKRDYDPGQGRYVQSDPIGIAGGINTYAYVEGNPLSFTDPTGELMIITGNLQGQSMGQSVQYGGMSTAAAGAGVVAAGVVVTGAAAAAATPAAISAVASGVAATGSALSSPTGGAYIIAVLSWGGVNMPAVQRIAPGLGSAAPTSAAGRAAAAGAAATAAQWARSVIARRGAATAAGAGMGISGGMCTPVSPWWSP